MIDPALSIAIFSASLSVSHMIYDSCFRHRELQYPRNYHSETRHPPRV
jgi:hypothetical protein